VRAAEGFLWMLAVTVGAYVLGRWLQRKTGSALVNPVFIGSGIVIAALLVSRRGIQDYSACRQTVTAFLGPATVALAVPLYRNRQALATRFTEAVVGVATGSLATIVAVVVFGHWLSIGPVLELSLSLKSVTAPIALEIARILGGNPPLTAILVVTTGITGAIVGPGFLSLVRVHDPVARGLAVGTTSHAIGTAAMLQEGETQGAMAGVAFSLNAVLMGLLAPLLIPWLLSLVAQP